jgi:hypothetical protein
MLPVSLGCPLLIAVMEFPLRHKEKTDEPSRSTIKLEIVCKVHVFLLHFILATNKQWVNSSVHNQETLATLSTQDTRRKQTKQKQTDM